MSYKAEEIQNLLLAGFSAFYVETEEPNRAREMFGDMLADFVRPDNEQSYQAYDWAPSTAGATDPLKPLKELQSFDGHVVGFLQNYNWYLSQKNLIQALQDAVFGKGDQPGFEECGKAIIIIGAKIDLPLEIRRLFTPLEFALPQDEEIIGIIENILPEGEEMPKGKELQRIIDAAKSMTRREMENTFSWSWVKRKKVDPVLVNEQKIVAIEKLKLAKVIRPARSIDSVLGYDLVKDHTMKTIDNPRSKGFPVIGPPGCGKTSLAHAVVTVSGKIGMLIDIGALQHHLRGMSERNTRDLVAMIVAQGNMVTIFDEMEKNFSGSTGSGELDGGVTRRSNTVWLDFLENRPPGIYAVATFNSFVGVPPEMLRVGRWDTPPWYIGMPNDPTKYAILEYYRDYYNIPKRYKNPVMKDWTGAEIEGVCSLANLRGETLVEASKLMISVAVTRKEEIDALNEWAKGRTNPAQSEDLFAKMGNGRKSKRKSAATLH